jgi:hypothetical protein
MTLDTSLNDIRKSFLLHKLVFLKYVLFIETKYKKIKT